MNVRAWSWPLVAAVLSSTATAAQVTELKPSEVAAFVARHEQAIVQVTSPDRKCGYCIDADKKLDKVAAAAGDRKIAFGRVQYAPWRDIPDFGELMTVYGVPTQAVFRNGKQIGDVSFFRPDPASFYANLDTLLTGPAKKSVAAATPMPAPKPLTADENAAVRLTVRHDMVRGVLEQCGKRFPAHAGKYRNAVTEWQTPRMDDLNKGTRLIFGGERDMKPLINEEYTAMRKWQSTELGIPMTKKVEAADCDRFAAGIATLQ